MRSASNPTFFSLCLFSHDIRDTNNDIRISGGGTGTPSPPSFHSSSEAGRSRWHSLRSFFLHRRRLTRLRVPRSFLFVSSLAIYDIRNTIYDSWRRDWDSNPDGLAPFTGFQDRLLANSDTPPTMFSLSTPCPSYKDGVLPG